MTLIVIDSIRYNLFFSYSVSAVVFIKSIEIYFPLCAVESSPRLYGEMRDARPSYDRIDEQELVPGITIETTRPGVDQVKLKGCKIK